MKAGIPAASRGSSAPKLAASLPRSLDVSSTLPSAKKVRDAGSTFSSVRSSLRFAPAALQSWSKSSGSVKIVGPLARPFSPNPALKPHVVLVAGGVGIATWITVVWGAGLPDYPGDRPHGSVTDYLPIVLSIVALVGAATWSLRRLWGAARALAGLASLAIVTVYGGSCTAGYVAYTIDQYHGSRALGAELLFIMALPIAAAWSLRRLWGSAGVGGGIAGARRAAFLAALLYAAICGVCLSLALVAGA